MPTLFDFFPDRESLLEAEPEDLGACLLLAGHAIEKRNGHVSISNYIENLPYLPDGRTKRSVVLAIAEALNWLSSQGIVMMDPMESSGSTYLITRLGKRLQSKVDVETFARGSLLPINLLHPDISTKVRPLFLRGDYSLAVAEAFRQVEIAVRAAINKRGGSLARDIVGASVMSAAFHPEKGCLRDSEAASAERQGLLNMFAGSFQYARNPAAHHDVPLEPAEAAQLIVLACHLYEVTLKRAR